MSTLEINCRVKVYSPTAKKIRGHADSVRMSSAYPHIADNNFKIVVWTKVWFCLNIYFIFVLSCFHHFFYLNTIENIEIENTKIHLMFQ